MLDVIQQCGRRLLHQVENVLKAGRTAVVGIGHFVGTEMGRELQQQTNAVFDKEINAGTCR